MRRALFACLFLLPGCLSFKDDGVYHCDLETGQDCVVRTSSTSWTRDVTARAIDPEAQLHAIWGTGPNSIWAVGNHGLVLHYDGSRWRREQVQAAATVDPASMTFTALAGGQPAGATGPEIWAVGLAKAYLHYANGTWTAGRTEKEFENATALVVYDNDTVNGVFGIDEAGSLFQLGETDRTWHGHLDSRLENQHQETGQKFYAIHLDFDRVDQADIAWVAGDNGVIEGVGAYAYDADLPLRSITGYPAGSTVRAFWGFANTDLWVAGDGGNLFHWDGVSLTRKGSSAAPANLRAGCGTDSSDVWVVGEGGYVGHATSVDLFRIDAGVTENLLGVWCSPDGVWAVGEAGSILRYHAGQ